VTGTGWLDREWSTSVLSSRQQGWDWFGLQLQGSEELMVFQLRRDDGRRDPFDQGLWVAPDGSAVPLGREDFSLHPLRYWHDEHGVSWPVAWQLDLRLPQGSRQYRVEAELDDQRMDTLLTYWEGLVRVLDAQGRAVGRGYMELTGYE
jgi:predicted secreted hydrolase